MHKLGKRSMARLASAATVAFAALRRRQALSMDVDYDAAIAELYKAGTGATGDKLDQAERAIAQEGRWTHVPQSSAIDGCRAGQADLATH